MFLRRTGIGHQKAKENKEVIRRAGMVSCLGKTDDRPSPNLRWHFPSLTANRREVRCRPGEAASKIPEILSPPQVMWGSTDFQTMADHHGKISHDTETWGCLLNPESFLEHQCHVSEGCSALQVRAKETWKLACPCVSARTHSYGIRAHTVCLPYRIMCVISNMCQAMCSLFTNYLISPVCSLRYRQCSTSLFPAFQSEWVHAKYFQKSTDVFY